MRDVTIAYDRLGRQVRISDGTGGRTNVYDASTLDLIEERLPDGSALARSQDSFGRASGIVVAGGGDPGNPDQRVAYGYDTSGRFGALTSTVGSVQSAFAYSYVPDSDLQAGWAVGGGIAFRRTYEPSRDLIATVTNTWNGTALGTFGYENDSLARRTKRIDSGSITNDFGYNLRSEVAAAMMGTNQFGYRYDPIGNRIASTNNAEAFSYAANELNQYTSIVDGGTVTPAYDDDGNLTSYGSWTYTWDGENRLVIATDGSVAVTNAYDFASRRAFKGTAVASRTFIYDGWNLISETKTQSSEVSTTFYVWGLDLSQTLQGAGGVGGLLSVVRGDAPYFTGYDANGNVTDYVSANGTTVAHYEFDPFGNTTAATGSMADAFVHRFSTKYWDSETALYYYGHRFYRPDLGRWITVDPLMHEGPSLDVVPNGRGERAPDLSAYAAMGNAAGNFIDPDGLATAGGCCGPDITSALMRTIIRIRSDFAILPKEMKTRKCLHLVARSSYETAWDIYPLLHIGQGKSAAEVLQDSVSDGSGGERMERQFNCEYTVAYQGKCFNAGYLNHIFWGTSWKLCFDHFGGWPDVLLRPPGYPRPVRDVLTDPRLWSREIAVALAVGRKLVMGNTRARVEVKESVVAGYTDSGMPCPAQSTHEKCALRDNNVHRPPTDWSYHWGPAF